MYAKRSSLRRIANANICVHMRRSDNGIVFVVFLCCLTLMSTYPCMVALAFQAQTWTRGGGPERPHGRKEGCGGEHL